MNQTGFPLSKGNLDMKLDSLSSVREPVYKKENFELKVALLGFKIYLALHPYRGG